MIVYSNTRIDNISKIERSVRLKIQKQMQMSLTWSLGKGVKEEHLRHEFLNRRKIVSNLSQRVQTEFLYKRLSCIYNEMERNTRRIYQGSIRIRK